MNKFILALFVLFTICINTAQENRLAHQQPNTAEIYHNIKKLGFLGSVLYVAAHPDDENTRLISWLANDQMARTAYLSLTRGDGGQNLIGPQLREQLGMIRTQELLEARNIDGGLQYFTRANDFGYSKHPDETLKIWDQKEVMEDMVQIIREFQPDIIINRFDHRSPGTTHGHHTSSAILSMKVFDFAASNTIYANQLKELDPWQAQRIFFNTSWWFYGSEDAFQKADKTNLLEINTGKFYLHKGLSNGEIAALSRSKHKSQGFGSSGSRDSQIEYLEYLKGSFPDDKSNIFSGINTTWSRVKGGENIEKLLKEVITAYDFKNPSNSIPQLLKLRSSIEKLQDSYWKKIKIKELDQILLDVTGAYLDAAVNTTTATAGESLSVKLELTNRSIEQLEVNILTNQIIQTDVQEVLLKAFESKNIAATLQIPPGFDATSPYYLKQKGSLGMYQFKDRILTGMPEEKWAFIVRVLIKIQGVNIYHEIPVIHKSTDPVRGEISEPLSIVPDVAISIENPVYVFTGNKDQNIMVRFKANKKINNASVNLLHPDGWQVHPANYTFDILDKGQEKTLAFSISPPDTASNGVITAQVQVAQKTYQHEVIKIQYDHIPDQQLVRINEAQVIQLGLENRAKTIAYINGAGDDVAQAIAAMGSKVFKFEPNEVPSDLTKYDAVVTGIRAFNVATNDMQILKNRLDTYVKNGGVLIMQYNTNRGISPDILGPLPISLSRKRVTDEKAAITILNPDHKIMNSPNVITNADFENWVQERGLYFPDQWDPAFTPILGMNDEGEEMTKGSLIVAPYGKGYVIYTGLSLFRELPAGVTGAYKLLANMISIGVENESTNQTDETRKL